MTSDDRPGSAPEPAAQPPGRRGLVLLTVEADAEVAGERCDLLIAEGIDAELHIEHAASFGARSSVYPSGQPFVYALFVPAPQHDAAAAALIESGWDGRRSPFTSGLTRLDPSFVLRGALLALLAGAAVAAVLLLLRPE